MTTDQTITCPNCQTTISVAASLSSQIRKQFESEFFKKQQELDQEKKQITETVQREKEKLWAIAQTKAREKIQEETQSKFKELEEDNKRKTLELRKAEEQELELRKKTREVEEKASKLELEVQRKLDEERRKITIETMKKADEEHRMKDLESQKQLQSMRQQIEELKRKSEQGSMQIQGEVQEEDLKQLLQNTFPTDQIRDVEKGVRGGDLVQVVCNSFGQQCGVILWESKNVKSWKDEWIIKLKEDQNIVKADVCILVTKVLPKGADSHTLIQNVWVVNYQSVLLITKAIRMHLQQLAQMKNSLQGRDEKMEVLYSYLSGAQFKNRVENIVSAFMSMQELLVKEKRAMQVAWSRREKEIERVINNTTGMYGDLQGIIGSALPEVSHLELSDGTEEDPEQTLF